MNTDLSRRGLLGAAVAAGAMAGATVAQDAGGAAKKIKVVGIACSYRKGKTTAAGLRIALDAAKEAGAEIELIELAGMNIPGGPAAGVPLPAGQEDDFPKVAEKLSDPAVAGILIGSPVYFNTLSSLCKAFLDRCMVFRKNFSLANKAGGALAVGAARNGGQELTVQAIQSVLTCHEMVVVGTGRPSGRMGATLVNQNDDVSGDAFGVGTAKDLGRRVAEVALRMAGTTK
jgi:multimeric flavodoxin WrbA